MSIRNPDFDGARIETIRIDLLDIPEYQRAKRQPWARKMATEWETRLFRHPYVVPREGGRYEVTDGQHTVMAAEMRGHKTIPCFVYHPIDTSVAAGVFSDVNTKRQRLTPYELYHADVIAGRPDALALKRITENAGLVVSHNSGINHIACIAAARAIVAKAPEDLEDTLYILTTAYPDTDPDSVGRVDGSMVAGMADLVRKARQAGKFKRETFVNRLQHATFTQRGIRGIRVTPANFGTNYIQTLIEAGHMPIPTFGTGAVGRSAIHARAFAIIIFGTTQGRKFYG